MRLEKLPIRLKCDNGCCGNFAEFRVVMKGTPTRASLRLCRSCLGALAALYAELVRKEANDVGTNLGDGDKFGAVGDVVRGAVLHSDKGQQSARNEVPKPH